MRSSLILTLLLMSCAVEKPRMEEGQWGIIFNSQAECEAAAVGVAGPSGGTVVCTSAPKVQRVSVVVPPSGGILITSKGAKCDGSTPDDAAIAATISEAKSKGVSVLVPGATCAYSDILTLDGVKMKGQGDASVLKPLTPLRSGVILRGTGAEVRDLKIAGTATSRGSTRESSGIVPWGAQKWIINNVSISQVAGAGVHVTEGASDGTVSNSRISNTLADSIHITGKSSYIQVLNNVVTGSGDDGVAVVSYVGDGGLSHHVTARGNSISDNKGGRGMSVVGGSDVLYENNRIANSTQAAGMYLSQESSYNTYGVKNAIVQFNTLTNCGNKSKDHYAVMLFTSQNTQYPNDNIKLIRNDIQGGPAGGIRVFFSNTNVLIDSNRIQNTSPATSISTSGVTVVPYTSGPVGVQ